MVFGSIFTWPFQLIQSVFAFIWPLITMVGVVMYVLRSMGLYKMARNTGIQTAWFAWVPLLHEFQCAKMGDRTRLAQGKSAFIEKGMVILAAIWLLLRIFSPIFKYLFLIGWLYSLLMGLSSLCLFIAAVVADYWTYQDFEPNMAVLYTILSVLTLDGIAKFVIRDNVPVGVAGLCSPKQPKYNL